MPKQLTPNVKNALKIRSSHAKKENNILPAAAKRWAASIAAAKGRQERAYSMTATYRIGDVLLHEQFGKGVVLKLLTRKCTVLFEDKERLMASANEEA